MVTEPLSDAAITAGSGLLQKLDDYGFTPESAMWLYLHSLREWRYMIATEAVDIAGRKKIYAGILDILDASDFGSVLTEADIHLVSPSEVWYQYFRGVARGTGLMHFNNCIVNGMQFDAVVYRFFDPPEQNQFIQQVDRFTKRARKELEKQTG